MTQTSVRAFVLVLSLAGLASAVNVNVSKGKNVTVSGPSHNIVPMCSPSDPNRCGID